MRSGSASLEERTVREVGHRVRVQGEPECGRQVQLDHRSPPHMGAAVDGQAATGDPGGCRAREEQGRVGAVGPLSAEVHDVVEPAPARSSGPSIGAM